MNEPHDMGSATLWPTAAQAAVNAIRAADMSTTIIVAGDGWNSSWTWPQNNARGFIGEFGVPSDDPRWLTVLENFAAALKQAGLSSTMWGGGSLWGDYNLAAERTDGQMGAQMEILSRYATGAATGLDPATRFGTAMADDLAGTLAGDWIYARSGDDRIAGLGGDDTLFGVAGDDRLDGGSGADTMRGGLGADTYIVDDSTDI